jgi:hypothetical protein
MGATGAAIWRVSNSYVKYKWDEVGLFNAIVISYSKGDDRIWQKSLLHNIRLKR